MNRKVCSRCKEEKDIVLFSKSNRNKDGARSWCKQCESEVHALKHPPRTLEEMIPFAELFIYANSMTEERFVPIKKFEGRFWISDFGRVVSVDARKGLVNFLHPYIDATGYYNTELRMKPETRKVRIHTLVGEHFVSKTDPDHNIVNHLLGIKLFNYYKVLEWTTLGDNVKHAVDTGLMDLKGEKHPNAKLTSAQVKEMRQLRRYSGLTHKEIAHQFGITRRQAGDVINGINWGWLKD